MKTTETIARDFILLAIQDWGQSDEERIRAIQDVFDAAGFDARAVDFPVFGRLWQRVPAEGPDGEAASVWLKELVSALPRGQFQDEEAHVMRAIKARQQVSEGSM